MNKKIGVLAFTTMILLSVFAAFMVSASKSESEADKTIDPNITSSKAAEKCEDIPVLLKSRQFVPIPGIEAGLERNMSARAASGTHESHLLIQFDHIPNASERKDLEAIGVDLHTYIPKNAWFADVKTNSTSKIKGASNVRWVGEILAADKIAPHILKEGGVGSWAVNPDGSVNLLVTFFDDVSADEAREIIRRYGDVVGEPVMSNYWRVTISEDDITNLAGEDAVQWIQEVAPPMTVNNDGSRIAVGANTTQLSPYRLNGSGVVIGEWDGGWADWTHNDLSPRVTVGDPASPIYPNCTTCAVRNHATHVAGTAMGDGTNSAGLLMGMAALSGIVTYEWPYTINELDIETNDAIVNHSAVISTNSWGWLIEDPDCYLHGYYGSWSQNYDGIVNGKLGSPITIIFAAGNEENDGDCPPYPWDQISGPGGTAKNTIVVGATYSDTNGHTCFSSRGPTDDGRIKPDVCAPGDEKYCLYIPAIKSTLPGNAYGEMAGTSMSAPAVAGCAALLYQDYRNTHGGADPTPATVKALLMHTAEDLGNMGPDYTYGWGLINVTAAADVIRADNNPNMTIFQNEVNNGDAVATWINVTPITTKLMATLVWTDEPGAPAAAVELVNDLDLGVTNDTATFHPWILDPDNPANPATTGIDNINNVEQVVINEPAPGTYTILVNGTGIPYGPQPFTLIVTVEEAEPRIEVNKTVWDPVNKAWVKEITANVNGILRFRCEIHNNGTHPWYNLTEIEVRDDLSDSLNFSNNATVQYPNGTTIPEEPDYYYYDPDTGESYLDWYFWDSVLEPCQNITIEFDARVVKCGEDWNDLYADAWCEEAEEGVDDEDRVNVTVPCFSINITSPENRTYASTCVRLNFTVEPEGTTLDWIGYCLDGGANVTITGNTTVSVGTPPYDHNIVVYANDTYGNMAASNIVFFATHPGDINGDSHVYLSDLMGLADAFNSHLGDPNWNQCADMDCNGHIYLSDLMVLADNFNEHY